jgi:hypothetical protein
MTNLGIPQATQNLLVLALHSCRLLGHNAYLYIEPLPHT